MSPAVLVVDDLRTFPHLVGAVYARTSMIAVAMLDAIESVGGSLHRLLLDHDLGLLHNGSVDDIRPVLDWLEERAVHGHPLPVGEVIVVSSNPVGAATIERALERHYRVRRVDATKAGAVVSPAPETPGDWPTRLYPGDEYENAADGLADAVEGALAANRDDQALRGLLYPAWAEFTDAAEARLMERAGRGDPVLATEALLVHRYHQALAHPERSVPLAEALRQIDEDRAEPPDR